MQRTVLLRAPSISDEHIKEKITCIRAHRERLFRISHEMIAGKHIFHNYGQGGAGWTFLFGSVHESMSQFQHQLASNSDLKNTPIVVIGAGCYGLLTATMLARAGQAVRIIAAQTEQISSYNAAGFFFPRPRKVSTAYERAIFLAVGMQSYAQYQQIIAGQHPFIRVGAKMVPAYYGHDIDPGFAPYIAQNLMCAPERVAIDFGTGKSYDALEYHAIFIDAPALMHELRRNVRELAIEIIQKEVESFDQISESLVFNCAAMGAKKLAGDPRLIPVQGHLISLQHQSVQDLQYMLNFKVVMHDAAGRARDELIYFAPKESGILGITFLRGHEKSSVPNEHEFDRLLQRCHDFFGF